jgi:hypothetical protein
MDTVSELPLLQFLQFVQHYLDREQLRYDIRKRASQKR